MNKAGNLEQRLNAFEDGVRREALVGLIRQCGATLPPEGGNVNMHFHSFFSYNAEGWSPSRIAWESRKAGLYAAGLCDFDVLDGLEEFLAAAVLLPLRATVSVETRVYVAEMAEVDISSPGEPGVTYIMGAGFVRIPADGSPQAAGLAGFRQGARERNVALVNRINRRLADIAVDYDADVLPLAPSGAATERHIVTAYIRKARTAFKHPDAVAKYWSGVLGRGLEETISLMADVPALEEQVRSKLVKRGGVGYEQPSATTFPSVDAFIRWVLSCEALPMVTWLDGTSGGEKDARKLLEFMKAKGAVALNIIPDRNWNIADPKARSVKQAHLKAIVEEANRLDLPINIGTEMNRLGLPFADDLAGPALQIHRDSFLRGARIMTGHTWLARYAGFAYTGAAARAEWSDARRRNDFFESVGRLPPPDARQVDRFGEMGKDRSLAWFRDQVAKKH